MPNVRSVKREAEERLERDRQEQREREYEIQLRKFLLSYRNPMYIDVYSSAAQKPALVSASRYNYSAARLYSNTHTMFD